MAEPRRGQNSFMRLHSDLVIEPGFNLREPTKEAIEEKLQSIISNGVITDFQVYKKHGADKYTIIEGHTRWLAIGKGITDGKLPDTFLIPCKSAKITSDKELNYLMLNVNNGVNIPPMGQAEGYRRAMNYGDTIEDIMRQTGVSAQHIKDCLLLLNANSGLQDKIKTNQVSATLTVKKMKEGLSSDEIEKQIETAQKETGKKKITEKNLPVKVPTVKTKQANILKEVSKADQFRTFLKNEIDTENNYDREYAYTLSMNEFNRIFQ